MTMAVPPLRTVRRDEAPEPPPSPLWPLLGGVLLLLVAAVLAGWIAARLALPAHATFTCRPAEAGVYLCAR